MTTVKRTIKIYHANNIQGYSNWITNREIVDNIEEADLVFFEGGADVAPEFYGEPKGSQTYNSPETDRRELAVYKEASKLDKPMFGTCKGLQLLCAMAGGRLVQHQQHPGRHDITTIDGQVIQMNSLHHQAAFPFNLSKDQYEVLATANNLSPMHLDGTDSEMFINPEYQEVEAAYFPKINGLGIQGHPEMMWRNDPQSPIFQWLYKQMRDKLGLEVE